MSHNKKRRSPKENIELVKKLLKKKEEANMPANTKRWSDIDMDHMSKSDKPSKFGKRKTKY